ncbi:hypothetical protein pb186bvf_002778 [Paramecium bursaria]
MSYQIDQFHHNIKSQSNFRKADKFIQNFQKILRDSFMREVYN